MCGYLLFTHCSFDNNKSKHDLYRVEDFLEKFCADLKKDVTEIINFEKKEMLPLTQREEESYKKQNFVAYASKNLMMSLMKVKTNVRPGIIVITPGNTVGLPIVSLI